MKEWNESKFYGLASKYYDYNQKMILSLIEKNPKAKILDIGCNDGSLTVMAGKAIGTNELHGLDIDRDCIRKAIKKGIDAKQHDVNRRLPYGDRSFDVVISNQVLEHIIDSDNFFKEIYRVLKPTGYGIISTPNLSSFHNLIFVNLGMQPPGLQVSKIQVGNFLYGTKTHGHIKLFTISALKDIARYHGLHVKNTFGVGIYPIPVPISNILTIIFKRWSVYIGIEVRKDENTSRM